MAPRSTDAFSKTTQGFYTMNYNQNADLQKPTSQNLLVDDDSKPNTKRTTNMKPSPDLKD